MPDFKQLQPEEVQYSIYKGENGQIKGRRNEYFHWSAFCHGTNLEEVRINETQVGHTTILISVLPIIIFLLVWFLRRDVGLGRGVS